MKLFRRNDEAAQRPVERRDILAEIIGGSIVEVLKLAVGLSLIALGALVASIAPGDLPTPPPWARALLLVIAGGALATVGILLFRRYHPRIPTLPPVFADFRVKDLEIEYDFTTIDEMVFRKKWMLKVTRRGVDRFEDRFRWTGTGDIEVHATQPGQRFAVIGRKNVWNVFQVRFNRTLNKGEVVVVELVWELLDIKHTAVSFFSTTIDRPTSHLRMILVLYPGSHANGVNIEKHHSISSHTAFWSGTVPLENDRAEWEVRKPRLMHYYEMNWHEETDQRVYLEEAQE
jgi:hypothetical protein